MCVCIVAPHSLKNRWPVVVGFGLKFRLHTPKPRQYVGGEHGNPRAGGDTGQSLLGARLAVRELVAANHDCDQTGNLGKPTRGFSLNARIRGIAGRTKLPK